MPIIYSFYVFHISSQTCQAQKCFPISGVSLNWRQSNMDVKPEAFVTFHQYCGLFYKGSLEIVNSTKAFHFGFFLWQQHNSDVALKGQFTQKFKLCFHLLTLYVVSSVYDLLHIWMFLFFCPYNESYWVPILQLGSHCSFSTEFCGSVWIA